MPASVVTFSNQLGSNGAPIARAVAERLGFRYYDWEVISQAAAEAGVPADVVAIASAERTPNFIERVMARLLAGAPYSEESPPPPPGQRPSILRSEDYRQFIEHVVRELGRVGDAVIVGHAGQAILKASPGVLKVLLHGSIDTRAKRLAAAQGTTPAEARKTIENSDQQRRDFFKNAYHMDWLEASPYDVALNTDRLSTQLAVDMIASVARELP